MFKSIRLIFLLLLAVPVMVYAQPSNDNCSSAKVLVLDSVATCVGTFGGGFNQGDTTTLTGQTNVGATSSTPYPYIAPCPININSTPKDVWYSFVATGSQTTVNVTGATGTLTSPRIVFWGGDCANLEGMGCAIGSGGRATLTVYQTIIGQTYYVQVAGADSTQVGTFTISASCANNCSTCQQQSFITPSVPPINGTYNPGQTVTFCFTVTQYSQINSNWLHGVTVAFGPGWDSASLVIDSVPPSCTITPGAAWAWYPGGDTASFSGTIFGPGFYYETSSGNANLALDSNPGNNFGDQEAGQGTCSPTFCVTVTANATDTPGSNLSISFATSGDGESGSWTSAGCGQGIDSPVVFYAVTSCSLPIMATHYADCNHNNGIDSATPVGHYAPFIFHWSNGYRDTTNGAPSVITGLAPGIYTVTVINSENCIITASDTVFVAPRPLGGGTKYVSCPTLTDSTVMTAQGIGTWAALPGNPAPTLIVNVDSPNTAIKNFTVLGTYYYTWQVGFCFDTVAVVVSSHPDAGPDVYTCVNGTATMAGIGTGTWSPLATNPAPTTITTVNSPTTTITGFTVGGTYGYVWTVGTCTDTADVIIPAFVSSAIAVDTLPCQGASTTLIATAGPLSLAPFTYAWSPASGVVSPDSATTATIPIIVPVTYILTVTSQSGCMLYDTVYVDTAITPSLPVLIPVTSACGQTNGQDTAIGVAPYPPYIFQWSTGHIDTGLVSVIKNLSPGGYTVTVINNAGCSVTATDTVTIQGPPYGGPTQYVSCPSLIDTVVMAGVGTGTWSALSTNPAPTTIDHPDSANTVIRNFTALGTYSYVWTVGFCSDTIAIIVSSRPNAGPDIHGCVGGMVTMAAIGTGTWIALPGNPAPTVIANPTANNTTISGFTVGGTYSYVWFVGTCADTANVIVPVFTSSATTADTVLCKYKSTTLSATAGPAGLAPFSYAWIPASTVVSPTSASTTTQPIQGPTNYVVAVTATGGCVLYDTVFVDVNGAAPRITITPSDNNVCPGDTITLTPSVLAENLVYCGTVDTCVTNNNLVSIAVSSDTSSTTGSPFGFTAVYCSPFMGSYNSYKAQYLFTKAELNAAGLSSGSITDISFFVKQVNSTAPYDTFTVSMGCTDEDSLTGFVNNLLEVVPPQEGPNAITPNEGWTPLPFTHFYNWDGSSNLVIQVCYTINPNTFSQDDYVSYSTTPYNGSSVIAGQFGFFGPPYLNGCSLDSASVSFTGFYTLLNTRPNVKFGQCVPNVLNYKWTPHTILCDTCPVTQVVVNTNSTYTLTVNDNGCSNDTVVNLTINPYIGAAVTPAVATVCDGNGVQLNVGLTNPPVSKCIDNYNVTSIPFSPISGTATLINPSSYLDQFGFSSTEEATAGPLNIGFTFPFYCDTFSQFYVNTDGWITFLYPYPINPYTQEFTASSFPTNSSTEFPLKTIDLVMGGYVLDDSFGFGGGNVSYFVTGTAPNRVLVIQFNDMQDFSGLDTTSGEMHLYEGTGVIDILIKYSDYAGTQHTTGINDSVGLGLAAPGMNNQFFVDSVPVAWRFTPVHGPSVAIISTVWSPNQNLSSDTITNPIATPTTPQTYIVTDTLIINQFTDPTKCVVKDTVKVNVAHFGGDSLTASPTLVCPGSSSQLTFTAHDTIISYSWTPASGLSDTTIADPKATISDTTQYFVTVVSAAGCIVRDSITLDLAPVPTVVLPASLSSCDCTPDVTVAPTVTGGTPAYTYQWSDGTSGATTADTSVGTTIYTLTVTDANHCTVVSNTDTLSMHCPRAVISVVPVSDTIFVHDTAVLSVSVVPGYTYEWTGDTTTAILVPNGSSTPLIGQIAGHDTVHLLVTDGSGCTYNAIQVINVVEFGNFAMATAFTPNGDGKNDFFYPVFEGPVNVSKFNIYDRWGQLVYDNPNAPGWDGSFKGKQEPSETYIYFITVEYPDPNDASRTVQRSVQGSFQLFR